MNPEPRCPVILLLDTSNFMSRIELAELNSGLANFKEEIKKDVLASLRVEVAVIASADKPSLIQDFITIDKFIPPQLEVGGENPMGLAINFALDCLDNRKRNYQNIGISYYRPFLFLISKGQSTDNFERASNRLIQYTTNRKLDFISVGVKNANIDVLRELHPGKPPISLSELNFSELFGWLSTSIARVSEERGSDNISLPPISGWSSIDF